MVPKKSFLRPEKESDVRTHGPRHDPWDWHSTAYVGVVDLGSKGRHIFQSHGVYGRGIDSRA